MNFITFSGLISLPFNHRKGEKKEQKITTISSPSYLETTNSNLNSKRESDHNYFVLEKTDGTVGRKSVPLQSNSLATVTTESTGIYNEIEGVEETYASIEGNAEDQYNTVNANNVIETGETTFNHYDVSNKQLEDYDHIGKGIKTVNHAAENDYDKTNNVSSLSRTMAAEYDPYSHLGSSADKKSNLENDYDSTNTDVSRSEGPSNY